MARHMACRGLGIAVFCYIYYGLTNYGAVIEAGTNATEDVAEGKMSHQRLVLTLALMMTALTAASFAAR